MTVVTDERTETDQRPPPFMPRFLIKVVNIQDDTVQVAVRRDILATLSVWLKVVKPPLDRFVGNNNPQVAVCAIGERLALLTKMQYGELELDPTLALRVVNDDGEVLTDDESVESRYWEIDEIDTLRDFVSFTLRRDIVRRFIHHLHRHEIRDAKQPNQTHPSVAVRTLADRLEVVCMMLYGEAKPRDNLNQADTVIDVDGSYLKQDGDLLE